MSQLGEIEEGLFEGKSFNLVGLPGAGRSRLLAALAASLPSTGWSVESVTGETLKGMAPKELRRWLAELRTRESPVVLIDDYTDLLLSGEADRVERQLFAASQGAPLSDSDPIQVVLSTVPRDAEIFSYSSGPRERMTVVDEFEVGTHRAFSGLKEGPAWEAATGRNPHFLPSAPDGQSSGTGVNQRSRALASWYVGALHIENMARLNRVLAPGRHPTWRDEVDSILMPVVGPQEEGDRVVAVPGPIDVEAYRALLLQQQWPDKDLATSAARFRARCGLEPAPLWVDSYLSDSGLDFGSLVTFLSEVLEAHDSPSSLRILSRSDLAQGSALTHAAIAQSLVDAGADASLLARLDWRLFKAAASGAQHDRQLILHRRQSAVALPPADRLLGTRAIGNSNDSFLATQDHQSVLTAWRSASRIAWPS